MTATVISLADARFAKAERAALARLREKILASDMSAAERESWLAFTRCDFDSAIAQIKRVPLAERAIRPPADWRQRAGLEEEKRGLRQVRSFIARALAPLSA